MSSFFVRVQLQGSPPDEEYVKLHAEMRKQGFSRFIQSSEKRWYKLPHAEYHRFAELTKAQILAAVKTAVSTATSRKREILVVEAKDATWDGLEEVSAEVVQKG